MDIIDFFKRVTNHEPYDYQIRAWEKINKILEIGGKIVIEIPTAGGKTEAAIIPYLYQFISNDWKVTKLIYVLPTRSLVEKQAERIRNYIKKILEMKGYSKNEAEELSKKLVQIEYGLEETHAFLGFVVLTTWDTFLYGLAAHRTVGDRFTFPCGAIAQSLVVFDEIQMYQDENLYMPRLIGLVVKRLVEANVPMIFMTATLPTELKKILNIHNEEQININPEDTKKPERGKVVVEFKEKLSDEELSNEIKKAINERKKVLIIKNTVNDAIEVYEKVKKFGNSLLLHSRFTVEDRAEKEKEIDNAEIIVATQVVEAGLDLPNVGLVITDLAPLDALIQRIGRCARRKGEKGKAIIVLPNFDEISYKKFKEKIILGFKDVPLENSYMALLVDNKDYGKVIEMVIEIIDEKKEEIVQKKFYIGDLGNKTIRELIKNNKILKKKDLYLIPYSTQPYEPLIMIKSFDKIESVSKYLHDIFKAREALDEVYKEYYENNIVPKDYYSAYIYFKELKLFSTPPEYELKTRPEMFAMLYPLKNAEEKAKNKETVEFNPKNVIRVSYNWLKNNWKEFKKKFELIKKYDDKNSWVYYIKETERLQPYKIYIVDDEYYSKEVGIIV
ncbi:CRISPR-associated helicase Cas3' [Methanocaldococcus sp.]